MNGCPPRRAGSPISRSGSGGKTPGTHRFDSGESAGIGPPGFRRRCGFSGCLMAMSWCGSGLGATTNTSAWWVPRRIRSPKHYLRRRINRIIPSCSRSRASLRKSSRLQAPTTPQPCARGPEARKLAGSRRLHSGEVDVAGESTFRDSGGTRWVEAGGAARWNAVFRSFVPWRAKAGTGTPGWLIPYRLRTWKKA